MAKAPKAQKMLSHDQIWTALDRLAERSGLSPSGLAKRSGLDPTTFNKSKRITPDGRERWPSTESVAKALAATNSSIDSFVQLIGDGARAVADQLHEAVDRTVGGGERLGDRFGGRPALAAVGGDALGFVEGGGVEAGTFGQPRGRQSGALGQPVQRGPDLVVAQHFL